MPRRTGIFGGTFDPPHIAHLILAEEALAALQLERLLWVLTPVPPHKPEQHITPVEHRLDMLRAAIGDHPRFELCRVDIDRPPPHYAADSMELIRERHPDDLLVYLMGGDSLRDLYTWYAPGRFVSACDAIAVVRRPDVEVVTDTVAAQLPGIEPKLRFVDAPLLEISASKIRARVSEGRPFRYYLLPAVYEIIQERRLYQWGKKTG
jgi:nicotinate-nucleotide adenylyltransferase